jgi:hypothetical protein
MLLVTFHGGKNLVNNVYAYNDSGGDPLEKAVLKVPTTTSRTANCEA